MKHKTHKIAMIGDGAWSTALALSFAYNGHEVHVWGAFPENIERIRADHENKQFLPGVKIPESIVFTADMKTAVTGADIVVLGTPSQYLRAVLPKLKKFLTPGKIVVNIAKGIELNSLKRMSELCAEVLGKTRYVVLSGPSHAEEVARRVPTLIVAASEEISSARMVQRVLMSEFLRIYTARDIIGVELGGALKNVFAIAAGIIDGVGLGDNAKAALMTRGIAEMARLGKKLGGHSRTFGGLSGIGDLIVTCMSRHSRNRHVGEELGRGKKLDEIIRAMNMVVAEGVKTCDAAKALADREKVETPIIDAMYELLHAGRDPRQIIRELMTRKAKCEHV